jgi:hypothetical protein
MWSEVATFMSSAIATFVFGFLGWLAANFLAKPFLDFMNLRGQVHEEVITANLVHDDVGTDVYNK